MWRYDIDSLDNRDPRAIEWSAKLVERALRPWFRYELKGVERVPMGAALFVGNHSGALMPVDAFLFGVAAYRALGEEGMPYGLGHEVAISFPILHQIIVPLGAVRASHRNAHRLFERGQKVLVYPGGDVDAMRPFRRRNQIVFGGRKGYVRLAVREGVPIVPVVTVGAHSTLVVLDDLRWLARLLRSERWLRTKVFPLSFTLPWGFTLGPTPPYLPLPSRILAEVLEPVRFERSGEEAADDDEYIARCDHEVRSAMQAQMDRLAEERRRRGGFLGGIFGE
jgi:1-acyl-sn-glycerol-3-phosphate acyltransferase